jgi:hypothetical protein
MEKDAIVALMNHEMNYFLPDLLVHQNSMLALIEGIRNAKAARMGDILTQFPENESPRIWRCIGWILKHGVGVVVGA